jgi:hypothetical protein
VSDTQTDSRRPTLYIDNGKPIVAWTEFGANGSDILAAQFDSVSNTWVALGSSLAPGGISKTARADQAKIVKTDTQLVVTWIDSSQVSNVYAKTFAADWVEITPGSASGLGITQTKGLADYDVATEGSNIGVAYSIGLGDEGEVFAVERSGSQWIPIGTAVNGGLVSNTLTESREPDIAWLNGQPFVAWRERVNDFEQVYVKTYVNGVWVSAGPDGAVGGGVSDTSRRALDPKLESADGQMYLAWVDHDANDYADPQAHIYVKRWDGTKFVETLAGDASGKGISATGGKLYSISLSVDAAGRPSVAWEDDSSGLPQVYLRSVTELPAAVFVADASHSVQSILDANDLKAGDVIVLTPGFHAGFTVSANDAGVLILGAQGGGSVVTGPVAVDTGATLQRMTMLGGVTVNGNDAALVDNAIGGAGLTINAVTGLQVVHNRFSGTNGIHIAAAAQGLILHNDVFASATGLTIDAAFTGDIRDNEIRNATVGVQYNAAAPLNANRIHNNTIGIRTTVNSPADGLGFAADSVPNEISANATGLQLVSATAQNQHVFANVRGASGTGVLGGLDIDHANLIERNGIGVDGFDGTIQFNRIGSNKIGVQAVANNVIDHNNIYRNTSVGVSIHGVANVHVTNNTMYTPSGDMVRVDGAATGAQVLGNILWTENGYDIFVANDSQTGFFSDNNNLYATGTGKVGFWTRDFFDVLDWQADIARFDLHSFGATVVNPDWARPRFVNLHDDDYSLFPMFGTQRFTSPGALPEASIPHIALRTPDLYVDAIREQALPIRWESFNNTAGSNVKIDLYQDTPDGPALLTTIVASTPDDGEFLWTPADTAIPFGTYGLRIQVSWVNNPVRARSQPGSVHGAGGRQ